MQTILKRCVLSLKRKTCKEEKVEEHNLFSEVRNKSRLVDLGWVEWRSFESSSLRPDPPLVFRSNPR